MGSTWTSGPGHVCGRTHGRAQAEAPGAAQKCRQPLESTSFVRGLPDSPGRGDPPGESASALPGSRSAGPLAQRLQGKSRSAHAEDERLRTRCRGQENTPSTHDAHERRTRGGHVEDPPTWGGLLRRGREAAAPPQPPSLGAEPMLWSRSISPPAAPAAQVAPSRRDLWESACAGNVRWACRSRETVSRPRIRGRSAAPGGAPSGHPLPADSGEVAPWRKESGLVSL